MWGNTYRDHIHSEKKKRKGILRKLQLLSPARFQNPKRKRNGEGGLQGLNLFNPLGAELHKEEEVGS